VAGNTGVMPWTRYLRRNVRNLYHLCATAHLQA
jgi:hypothetical protein